MNRRTLVGLLLLWSLGPLLWQVYTSFCSDQALIQPFVSHDQRWTLIHYQSVLNANPPFWRYLVNSLIVGISSTFLCLLLALPAAYALNRIPRQLSTLSRLALVGAALFPYVLLFLGLLELARTFNLGNQLLALSLPYAALSQPLAIFLLNSAFHDLPPEIDKIAARIYCKLADIPMAQIYDKLNITSSSTNRVSPIETKWVYHYIKKYKTTKFHSANTIDDLTLLAPLTDQQRVEYQRMKF